MEDPTDVCEKAGVQLPANLGTHNLDTPATATLPRSPGEEGEVEEERECGVCVVNFTPDIEVPCGHVFCRDCWREYLHQKIEAGDAHSIVCPEYGCFKLVPIVSLVARITVRCESKASTQQTDQLHFPRNTNCPGWDSNPQHSAC